MEVKVKVIAALPCGASDTFSPIMSLNRTEQCCIQQSVIDCAKQQLLSAPSIRALSMTTQLIATQLLPYLPNLLLERSSCEWHLWRENFPEGTNDQNAALPLMLPSIAWLPLTNLAWESTPSPWVRTVESLHGPRGGIRIMLSLFSHLIRTIC